MVSKFDDETTIDMNCGMAQTRYKLHTPASELPTSASVEDGCESCRMGGRERGYFGGNQYGQQCHRRNDKAMHTLLVIGVMAFTICLSTLRAPFIFVDSFSFKLFHRSGGRHHNTLREKTAQILSASSAEEDIANMNSSFENSVKNANSKNTYNKNNKPKNKNGNLPSLVDWEVDSDGQRITGRSVNHPFVPDGELITTSCLDPSCMDGALEAGDVVSTIQGTKYELLKPPPVGSSYFATPSSSSTNQVFKEDIFSLTTTGLPYDEQLAFLEELTDMVKAKQAAEGGTTAAVTKFSPSTQVTSTPGASASTPAVGTSSPTTTPLQSTLGTRETGETQSEIPSSLNQPELKQQNQQVSETSPQRPTFSINKSLENQEREKAKEGTSSNSKKIDDNSGSLLGNVATVAVAAAASAAVTLGGQTGLANDLLDDAKRQAESQIPPQTKELLASINTQVEETSKVVLPYLEEQIRIAEAKAEEARLEEKAKNAWNGVANYLNAQSRSTAPRKVVATSTASSEATKSMGSSAVEEVASASNVIAGSTTPAVDNKVTSFEKSPDRVELETMETVMGTEQTTASTNVAAEMQVSAEVPSTVKAESAVTKNVVEETASTAEIIEEVASAVPTEKVVATATIEEALTGAAVISSNSPQSFVEEQTSQESEQVKAVEEMKPETLQPQSMDSTAAEAEVVQDQVVEMTQAEADAVRVQTMEIAKAESVQAQEVQIEQAKVDAIQVQTAEEIETAQVEATENVEAETEGMREKFIEATEGEVKAAEIAQTIESTEAESEAVQLQAMEKAKAETEALRAQDAEKVEAEAEVLRVRAMMEEQELTEAARIVEEQLEAARREVEQAAVLSSETPPGVKVPLVAETTAAKVEVLKGSEPFAKSPPSVVETFGGNFVVAQKESKLGNAAAVSSTVSDSSRVGVSETNVEKPTPEMVKNAITVEVEPVVDSSIVDEEEISNNVEPVVDSSLVGDEETSNSATEETMKQATTEVLAGSAVLQSEIKASTAVENSPSIVEKVTDVVEKGKKTAEAIGNAGREVIDTGKRTVQDIKTTGQELVDTGKRTYETAVDTGRKVVDTGKRTAKAIEETGQMVGAKGKEVYETGQKYAKIGKEILEDEHKVKAIVDGATITAAAGVAVAFATDTISIEGLKKALSDQVGEYTQSETGPTNGTNETFARIENNGENSKNQMPLVTPQPENDLTSSKRTRQEAIEPEMLSSMPSPRTVSSPRIEVKTNDIIDTTSTQKSDVKESSSPFGSPPKQSVPSNRAEFGVPSSKSSTFGKKAASPFRSPPKQTPPFKKAEFGVPSSKSSTFGKKAASPFGSTPKQTAPFKKAEFGVPSSKSSTFGKKVALPFDSLPKQGTLEKREEFGIQSSKSSTSGKKAASPFGSPPKQGIPAKGKEFGVPSSKNSTFGKKATSPFESPSKQSAPGEKVEVGVPSAKSNTFGKKAASPFGSPPKQVIPTKGRELRVPSSKNSTFGKNVASPFESPSKQSAPGEKVEVGVPSAKSNTFGKKAASPFGSPPKQSAPFKKAEFGISSSESDGSGKQAASLFGSPTKQAPSDKLESKNSSDSDNAESPFGFSKKSAPTFGSLPKQAAPGKKVDFGVPSSKSSIFGKKAASPFGTPPKQAVKFPPSPFGSKSSVQTEGAKKFGISTPPPKASSEKEKTGPQIPEGVKNRDFDKVEDKKKFPISRKADEEGGRALSLNGKSKDMGLPKFGIPPRKFPSKNTETIKQSLGNGIKSDGPSKKAGLESTKSSSPFGEGNMKSSFPSKAIPTSDFDTPSKKAVEESGKNAVPFAKADTKSSFPPKAVPASKFDGSSKKFDAESAKSASSFGEGKAKSPFPPTKGVPTSKFDGPSKKFGSKSVESASQFEGKTKSPFPSKGIPTSEFDGPSKKFGSESVESTSRFEGKTKSPFPSKGIPTSKFDGPSKKFGAESPKTTSPFAGKTKSPFPRNEEKSGGKPDFGSSSNEMLSNKSSNKSTKKIDRSYFTDTSRNGYDESSKNTSNDSAKYGGNNNDKRFPMEQNSAKEASSSDDMNPLGAESIDSSRPTIEDDREVGQESTYLTEENQKRFFPEPGSTQEVELGYRVGASIEENRDQRKASTYLTEEKNSPVPPKDDDSKPRITSMDESVSNGSDGMYGKSPDELMAEVMRIAREQEERNAR